MTEQEAIERITQAVLNDWQSRAINSQCKSPNLTARAAWNEMKAIAREDAVTVSTQTGGNPLDWPITKAELEDRTRKLRASLPSVRLTA